MTEHWGVRQSVLLTDGGEDESEGEESADGSEAEEQSTDAEGDEGTEAEGEETEEAGNEEEEGYEDQEGTNVLHLDLEGLFLDLLGLEVDLNEVILDIRAMPGSGNLVGNLLSQVAGLLDDGLGGLLSLSGDGIIGKKLNSLTEGISKRIRNSVSSVMDEIPIESLLRQLIVGLVEQLLGRDIENGEQTNSSEQSS